MRKLALLVGVVLLASALPAGATTVWQQVDFNTVVEGGLSYSASGANVVQSGSAFYDQVSLHNYLSFQKAGGDGINDPVSGSLALYGVFTYTDTANVLAWATAHSTTPFALEIRAWGVQLDLGRDGGGGDPLGVDGDGNIIYEEAFTLDAKDMPGVDYLMSTFAELAGWGCTEVAPGVWLDIALSPSFPGAVALSVVMEGYHKDGWGDIDAYLVPGDVLQGYTPGITPGSGMRISDSPEPIPAAVPEPLTMVGVFLGVAGLGGYIRRRRVA